MLATLRGDLKDLATASRAASRRGVGRPKVIDHQVMLAADVRRAIEGVSVRPRRG